MRHLLNALCRYTGVRRPKGELSSNFDGFLNFWVFLCGKLTNCQVLTRKPHNFNKMVACSHHCLLRHPAPSLGHWYTGVYLRIFDPGPSNPTTFLRFCSPGNYRQSRVSNERPHLQLYRKGAYINYL